MTFSDFENELPLPTGALNAFPCTLAQQRIWTASRQPGGEAHNIAMRWLVHGRLPHSVVEEAFNLMMRRHEILRTSFREGDGTLAQIVWPEPTLRIREIDLVFMSEQEKLARAEEIARAEASQPMDLRAAPLLRPTVLRFGPERGALLLTLHSIVADGWSVGILIREFQAAAAALANGSKPELSPLELQFADYALWEREMLASGALDESRAYWRRRLRRASPTQVPPDRLRSGASLRPSQIGSQLLPAALSQELGSFAREHGATAYGVAAAALAAALHRITGQTQIAIGSQVANREDALTESLVGPIVNSITLCFEVDDRLSKSAFVRQAAESIQEALVHQRLPAEAVHSGRPAQRINLVVQRAYSDVSASQGDGQPFQLIAVPSLATGALWDLNFFMIKRTEGWRISCEADTDLYDSATVDLLLSHWRAGIEALVRAPDERLSDCEILRRIPTRAPEVRQPIAAPAHAPLRWRPRKEAPPVDPSRLVVRFNEGGARTPVIALNHRSVYFPLAQKLGTDRPFIDIQVAHADGPFDLPRRAFEDFAADAVRLIRWAQPKGPYILCGYCVYGALAFEAARQLRREGDEIALVVLVESRAPGFRETLPLYDKALRKLQLRLTHYARKIGEFRRGKLSARDIVWLPILRRLGMAPRWTPPPEEWFDNFLLTSVLAYRPNPYDGDVLYIRSDEMIRGRLFDPRAGWEPLVGGEFRVVDVRGMHMDVLRAPYVDAIADAMRAFLGEIEG